LPAQALATGPPPRRPPPLPRAGPRPERGGADDGCFSSCFSCPLSPAAGPTPAPARFPAPIPADGPRRRSGPSLWHQRPALLCAAPVRGPCPPVNSGPALAPARCPLARARRAAQQPRPRLTPAHLPKDAPALPRPAPPQPRMRRLCLPRAPPAGSCAARAKTRRLASQPATVSHTPPLHRPAPCAASPAPSLLPWRTTTPVPRRCGAPAPRPSNGKGRGPGLAARRRGRVRPRRRRKGPQTPQPFRLYYPTSPWPPAPAATNPRRSPGSALDRSA
jgi:hypothetical protein